MNKLGFKWVLLVSGLIALGTLGCSGFDNTKIIRSEQVRDAGGPALDSATAPIKCTPIQGQPIPSRLAVMSADALTGQGTPVFIQDLFNRFNSTCGGCHVAANQGNFQVSLTNFATLVNQSVVDLMNSDDPTVFMPPPVAGGIPASQRQPSDPVAQLATLLTQWMAAGSPNDVFYINQDRQDTGDAGAPGNAYLLTGDVGNSMTNIGACLPDKSMVATQTKKMDELDAFFAQLNKLPPGQGTLAQRIGLPETLDQTDLFTLDTATLAQYGVIAYAPAYPLWSDNAGKLRMVRVPRGQSITFDASTQTFNIPPNTRFYKTFLKEITDTDGSTRYRKIETRLIVSRPDQTLPDGTAQNNALFGTYAWNDDETEANLVEDPLRNGEPFIDRLITYITDEPGAAKVRATNPPNLSFALQAQKLVRHYAIPGSDRCQDCHMGSPSQSFILGFTPLQIKRRPVGEGGIIEPAAADELTQLQRLIDFGVITGVNSPDDISNLEDSQGTRKPRNNYELTAQGYMIGNCAHCHNPRGEPTVDNPVLANVLDFLPGTGQNQGIFQFPLEQMSPRISRDLGGAVSIPYITPSLMDYSVEDDPQYLFWKPKADATGSWPLMPNIPVSTVTYPPGIPRAGVFAPWRSLIFRNVDTPFAYSDNFALFPHMPKHVPGYDCRAAHIMGDWMVSIPARRKHPNLWEFGVPTNVGGSLDFCGNPDQCDTEPQPYVGVTPGDPNYDYDTAVSDAANRLDMYHSAQPTWQPPWYGPFPNRYTYCPDTSDIVDIAVLYGSNNTCAPQLVPASGPVWNSDYSRLLMPDVNVPLQAHWVVTDLTDVPGDWYPRRSDWDDVLVNQNFAPITGTNCGTELQKQAQNEQVVQTLQSVTLSPSIRSYALNEIPLGLWVNKPTCNLSGAPTVSQLASSAQPPKWLSKVQSSQTPPAPSSPVYTELPGAAVFNMICVNCHGAKADSQGRLADNLMTMTGGSVRVANLRDGLFGPVGTGTNRPRVFGPTAATLDISPDDLASRYLAWMALGGTQAHIPPSILNIVGNTQVLGVARRANVFSSVTATSANMLATAQELCRNVLPLPGGGDPIPFYPTSGSFDYQSSSLIATNGDAELWQNLCSIDNPTPIRGLIAANWTQSSTSFTIKPLENLYRQQGYPPNYPVGNQYGQIVPSLQADNTMPWCIMQPTDPTELPNAQQYVVNHAIAGNPLPFCPQSLTAGDYQMRQDSQGNNDLYNWADRGAINAGLAVFLYLDQVVVHGLQPKPSYDQCELLNN